MSGQFPTENPANLLYALRMAPLFTTLLFSFFLSSAWAEGLRLDSRGPN
jgi:hypothetical protein